MRAITQFEGSAYRYGGELFESATALYTTDSAVETVWPSAFSMAGRSSSGQTMLPVTGPIEVVSLVASIHMSGPEAITLAQSLIEDGPEETEVMIGEVNTLTRHMLTSEVIVNVKPNPNRQGGVYIEVLAVRARHTP